MIDPKKLLNSLGASPCKINDLVLDVVITEGTETSWTTSEYKLQSGFVASDARIKDRVKLNLEVVFVDKTYDVVTLISAAVSGDSLESKTWRDKYSALKDLADSESVVTVTLGIGVFSNMTIKSIGTSRDEKRAGYLSFSMALEELPIVDIDFDEVDTSLMPKDEEPKKEEEKKKKKSKKPDKKNEAAKKATEPERGSTLNGMTYGS